jgi:hypothetical protein
MLRIEACFRIGIGGFFNSGFPARATRFDAQGTPDSHGKPFMSNSFRYRLRGCALLLLQLLVFATTAPAAMM